MLKAYVANFVVWVNHLNDVQRLRQAELSDHFYERITEEWVQQTLLPMMKETTLHLPATNALGVRYDAAVKKNPENEALGPMMEEFRSRLEDELQGHKFYYVRPDLVGYYDAKQPFGPAASVAFFGIDDEIADAGKCLALGQGTACVFHLMRVMEVALRRFGRELGIPYAPSWESYIKQITAKIGEKHKSKSAKWKRQEPFFRDALGDLQAIKIAWRNPTMHVVRRYSEQEAKQIYTAVQHFMNRFAWSLMPPGWKPPGQRS